MHKVSQRQPRILPPPRINKAMGQNTGWPPVNIPIPTRIGSKMGVFTYQLKWYHWFCKPLVDFVGGVSLVSFFSGGVSPTKPSGFHLLKPTGKNNNNSSSNQCLLQPNGENNSILKQMEVIARIFNQRQVSGLEATYCGWTKPFRTTWKLQSILQLETIVHWHL